MSMKLLVLLVGCLQIWARSLPPHELLATAYATNFSVIDSAMWVTDTSCFSCKAPKDPKTAEYTNNTVTALRPGSIANIAEASRSSHPGRPTPVRALQLLRAALRDTCLPGCRSPSARFVSSRGGQHSQRLHRTRRSALRSDHNHNARCWRYRIWCANPCRLDTVHAK